MTDVALDGAAPSVEKPDLPWSRFGPILAINFLGTLGFSLAISFLVFIVTDLGGASWTCGLVGAILTLPLLLIFTARALDGATGGNISMANVYVGDRTARWAIVLLRRRPSRQLQSTGYMRASLSPNNWHGCRG